MTAESAREPRLARWLRCISMVFGAVATVFLLFMMLGTTADALARGLFGRPISGVFEMSELAMVVLVFFGLGWTQQDDAHIRVTLLQKWLGQRQMAWLGAFGWSLAALVLVVLAWPATAEALESFQIREFRWGYVEVPIWWAKGVVAIGLWFGAVQMLAHAWWTLRGTAAAVPVTVSAQH